MKFKKVIFEKKIRVRSEWTPNWSRVILRPWTSTITGVIKEN